MKALIEETYQEVSSGLKEIHSKRKRLMLFQKLMWGITGVVFILMLLNMFVPYFPDSLAFLKSSPSNPYASAYPIIALIVLIYPTIYFFTHAFRKFKTQESELVTRMVKKLFPTSEFALNTAVPSGEIEKSKLFAWIKENTPMYCYGQIRNASEKYVVNIADIGIIEQNISKRFMDSLMRIPVVNVFAIIYQYAIKNVATTKTADNLYYTYRGMFCWLRFKQTLTGHTVVLTNNQGAKLNRYFSSQFKEEERIHLEDPRFNKQFIVYSTDQIEARYVLTLALMERIVELKEKFDQPILVSFRNKEMYLAVENKHGLFSFPAEQIENIEIIEALAHDIKTAIEIPSALNLKH